MVPEWRPKGDEAGHWCDGVYNLPRIGVGYNDVYTHTADGKIGVIHLAFRRYDYGAMRDLLVARYGEPTKRDIATAQTRGGARFRGEEFTWAGQEVTIVLSEYGSKIDDGAVLVSTKTYRRNEDAASKSRAEKFKENL